MRATTGSEAVDMTGESASCRYRLASWLDLLHFGTVPLHVGYLMSNYSCIFNVCINYGFCPPVGIKREALSCDPDSTCAACEWTEALIIHLTGKTAMTTAWNFSSIELPLRPGDFMHGGVGGQPKPQPSVGGSEIEFHVRLPWSRGRWSLGQLRAVRGLRGCGLARRYGRSAERDGSLPETGPTLRHC